MNRIYRDASKKFIISYPILSPYPPRLLISIKLKHNTGHVLKPLRYIWLFESTRIFTECHPWKLGAGFRVQ